MTHLPERQRPRQLARHDGSFNLIELFLQRYEREETKRAYERDLLDFFGLDEVHLDDAAAVTFVEVNKYLATLQDQGYKPSTLKRRTASIRGFFDWLIALGAIEKNPAHRQLLRRVRTGRTRDHAVTFLSADEAARLVEVCDGHGEAAVRDRTLITTLLHCVLRRSEAMRMNVDHLRPLGPYWILDLPETKGGSDQYVKVPGHIAEEIEQHRRHYGIESGPVWRSLSSNNRDGRLSAHSIYRIVKQAATEAGVSERVGAHTLRHTGCTLAIEAGASVQQVQTHARHKNIETTMNYIHQRDKLRDSAADFIRLKK